MNKIPLILLFAVLALSSAASALDIPGVRLGFNLGFDIRVVPAPGDKSPELGLYVSADKIISDKARHIAITGTIYNYGPVARDFVELHFAVDSHVGTGISRGAARVEPTTIPPGGSASFTTTISLDSQKPRFARYTLTARPDPVIPMAPEPVPEILVPVAPASAEPIVLPE